MEPQTRAALAPGSSSTTVVSQSCGFKDTAHGGIARPYARADQCPIEILACVEEIVQVYGLMGTMEISNADMENAGTQRLASIGRPTD